MKIRVSNVTIELRKRTLELTLDEARELQRLLNDVFPVECPTTPAVPIIIERPYWPWRPGPTWTVMCDNQTETLCLSERGPNA